MNVFSFDDFSKNHNVVLTDSPDRFKTDIDAVRDLLAANVLESWHCVLNYSDDPYDIPADNPMRQFIHWENGSDGDPLICDMSCPSVLGDVLDVLPDNVEFEVFYWADFDGRTRVVVWIRPTYEDIAEMGIDRFAYLCNSAG